MDDTQARMAKLTYDLAMKQINEMLTCDCGKCIDVRDIGYRAVDNLSGPLAEFIYASENMEKLKSTASVAALASEYVFNMLAMQCFDLAKERDPEKAADEFQRMADFYQSRVDHFSRLAKSFKARKLLNVTDDDLRKAFDGKKGMVMLPMIDGEMVEPDLSNVPEEDRPMIKMVIDAVRAKIFGGDNKPPAKS